MGKANYGLKSAYSHLSLEVDTWLHSHPEALVVFAVGNEGFGKGTILSPLQTLRTL